MKIPVMTVLEAKQERMQDRLADRREIAIMLARTDLVCPICKITSVTASKRTGMVLTCKSCYLKKWRNDLKKKKEALRRE